MEEKKLSLSEILEQANAENQKKIDEQANFKPSAPAEESPDSRVAASSTEGGEGSVSETDEIIDKYSQRIKPSDDPRTSTASLRESLAALMENDSELVSYYNNGKRENKKFDELYTLINTASISNVKHREAVFPKSAGNHFVDEDQVKKPENYRQQNLFGGDDTVTFKPISDTGEIASFDDTYDALGKKIESGEIDFTEDENEDQLTLTDDVPKTVNPESTAQLRKNQEDKEKQEKKNSDLINAFSMIDDDDDGEDIPVTRKEKKRKQAESAPKYEYTTTAQQEEVDTMLRKAIKLSRIKVIFTLILTLAILYTELSFKGSTLHPQFLQPGRNGMIFILVDLQLLCLVGITMRDSLLKGFTSIFRGKTASESVMSVSMVISAVYAVVAAVSDSSAVSYGLVCLPAACTAFCCALADWLTACKNLNCFTVICSKRPKYVAEKLKNTAREGTEFYKYLLDDSELYTVKRTDFVDGFISRITRRPEGEDLFGFLILIILVAGAALFGIQYYLGESLYSAYTSFTKLVAFSLPVSAFFIINLPVISANMTARRSGSALIGSAVGEEYSEATVISFADTEVYPSSRVKIASIKTYGDYRIDHIILDLAKVFNFVGGPLKNVTSSMISGVDTSYSSARLIESASDGICVVVDGKEMFLGQKSYLRRYRFETPVDSKDESFKKHGGSIMYVTLDDKIIAKVYIKYKISEQFNRLLRDMYRAGLCVGIKTVDPNINASLLESTVRYKKCPISILKAGEVSDVEGHLPNIDSGIVSTASLHTFLKMFVICDKVRHVIRSNGFITVLSIVLSFFVSFYLAYVGDLNAVSSFYPVLFQLLWLLPIGAISFIL